MSGVPSSRVNASRFLQRTRGFVHVGSHDLIEESLELAIGEFDAVQGFELFPEVRFKHCLIADVGAVFVFEVPQLRDKCLFKLPFRCIHRHREDSLSLAFAERVRLPGLKCERDRRLASIPRLKETISL